MASSICWRKGVMCISSGLGEIPQAEGLADRTLRAGAGYRVRGSVHREIKHKSISAIARMSFGHFAFDAFISHQ